MEAHLKPKFTVVGYATTARMTTVTCHLTSGEITNQHKLIVHTVNGRNLINVPFKLVQRKEEVSRINTRYTDDFEVIFPTPSHSTQCHILDAKQLEFYILTSGNAWKP